MGDEAPRKSVGIRTMARGTMCALREPRRAFFNSGARMLDLLTEARIEVEASHSVGPPDWTRETAVFVAMGTRPTGGFSIEIAEAWMEPRALVARVRVKVPAEGENATMALTSPFHLAVLEARAPIVRFD